MNRKGRCTVGALAIIFVVLIFVIIQLQFTQAEKDFINLKSKYVVFHGEIKEINEIKKPELIKKIEEDIQYIKWKYNEHEHHYGTGRIRNYNFM